MSAASPAASRFAPHRALAGALLLLALLLAQTPLAHARQGISSPVFLDDSPAAAEGLIRARELAASGNLTEASRVLQRLLDEEPDRVLATADDADLFTSVRERVHEALLSNPELLARYREIEGPIAQRMLDEGRDRAVETSRLLTTPGLEAATRVARRMLENAQFWGAWRVLEATRDHPDARSPLGVEAVALALDTARYLDQPALWELVRAWAEARSMAEAAAEAASRAVRPPDILEGVSPFDRAPSVELGGMLARPLSSESLRPDDASIPNDASLQAGAPPQSTELFVLPTVAGDTIYINTGRDIFAWDRFTLTPRWPRREFPEYGAPDGGNQRPNVEDTATATVWGPWLVATTGLARAAKREGDLRTHAIDLETGDIVWSADLGALDPALTEASPRGPAIIDQNVVVIGAVRMLTSRRLTSAHLVGLDLATGELLWSRHLASAGAPPYGRPFASADAGVAHRGVTLRTDRVGVVSAVDVVTGRLHWARRIAPESLTPPTNWPWETHTPVVDGDRMFTLSPDRRELVSLDVRTGRVLGRLPARDIGAPVYILGSRDKVIAVGRRSIFAVDKSLDPEGPEPMRLLPPDGPEVRGRVVVAGDTVLAPVSGGVVASPISSGERNAEFIALDRPGNILPMPDELVIVDDYQVHTYLLWEVAERMLSERMHANPSDPTPAVTYAELAHRAGKPDRILPAADRAIEAIRAAPTDPRNDGARRRLFRSTLAMLEPGAPAGAPLGEKVVEGLIDRLGALASAPEERVAHLLAAGEHAEAVDRGGRAIERYQSILEEPTLANATFSRRGVSTPAEIEATRRLRRVIREHGPSVYTVFEAEAERALAEATRNNDIQALENIGARWPVSAAAARAWLLAADAHSLAGDDERAARALEAGLLAADDALLADASIVGELGGRLVMALESSGQSRAAAQTLARLLAERPGVPLTERGVTIDIVALASSLDRAVAALDRRPSIGTLAPDQTPQVLEGWMLVQPVVSPGVGLPADHVVMVSQGGYLGVFEPSDTGVQEAWRLSLDSGAKLVSVNTESLFLSVEPDGGPTGGRTVTRFDLDSGPDAPVWTTPAFRSIFNNAPDDPRLAAASDGRLVTMRTPLGGVMRITDLLVVFDQRSFALIERTGRAAGFDLESGQLLWSLDRTLFTVHDAAADAGVLVIGGTEPPAPGLDPMDNTGRDAMLALDMRTGRTLHKTNPELGQVRWVRVSPAGRAVLGLDGGVVCVDALQAETRWRLTAPAARASVNAWRFPDRLVVMDSDGLVWQIDEDDGRVRDEALDVRGRLKRGERIVAQPLGDRALFMSASGIVIIDARGDVIGRDVRPGAAGVATPILTDSAIVAADYEIDTAGGVYNIRHFTPTSAAQVAISPIALGADPFEIGAVDGRLLVSAGDVTIVYRAPAQER